MVLKKPSDYFAKNKVSVDNSVQEVVKKPELDTFSDAFQSFKNNLSKIEVLSDFSETLDNYRVNIERVNHLSTSIEEVKIEIQNLLKKEDLDRAMMSQLLVVEQSIQEVQNKVSGINEKNLTEIRLDVAGLTENVNEFLEIEVPKYKKLIVDSELRTNNRYEELEESVNKTLEGVGEFVENKYQQLTESLEGINEKSLSGILEDFKSLENNLQKIKEEDIPKYKGFIVETERKTESKFNVFEEKFENSLNSFEKELEQTVKEVFEKINLVEDDKEELVSQVIEKIEDVNKLSKQVSQAIKTNENYTQELKEKVTDLEVNIIRNETHIRVQNKNLQAIQEEVKDTLSKINLDEIEKQNHKLGEKIKYLEEVFEKFNEKEILTENLLAEPPSIENKDPLTPLDQNFVTLEQLQEHYRLFINRIQQQLATIGGGGETRLKYLDDIVGIATNPSVYDGKFLTYDHAIKKFEFVTVTQGGGGNVAIAITNVAPTNPSAGNLWYDLDIGRTFLYYTDQDGSQWVDANPAGTSSVGVNYWGSTNAGIYTTGNVAIGTNVVSTGSTAFWVQGDARITGILSVGQGTITIDGNTNTIRATNIIVQNNITGTNNIGIGTTNPLTALDVRGDITLGASGIHTISSVQNDIVGWEYSGISTSVTTQDGTPVDLYFKSDGTKMYMVGSTNDRVNEYALSTPWNVSTAGFTTFFSTASQDTDPAGLYFKPDGTAMYVSGFTAVVGAGLVASADYVHQYTLSTPWSIAAGSVGYTTSFRILEDTAPNACFISTDGTKLYVAGATNDRVYQYNLSTPWSLAAGNVSFASSISLATQETNVTGIDFNSTGTIMWLSGSQNDRIYQYNLSTPWTLSSATFYDSVYVGHQENSLQGVYVEPAQNKAYIVGGTNDTVYQYNTNTPAIDIKSSGISTASAIVLRNDVRALDNMSVRGRLTANNPVLFNSTLQVDSSLTVSGGTITAGNVAASLLTGNTTTNINFATGQTTGTLTVGGASQTGTITLDQSTSSHILNIASGVSTSGVTKTINIGTGGTTGSFTNINIGPVTGIGTVVINSGTNVGIGSTIPTAKLDVQGGDIRVGLNTSQGVILTSPNGTKYRLIVDNAGVLSTVLAP